METLKYRKGDRFFPEGQIQSIYAEKFMDIDLGSVEPEENILEGLCFDGSGDLYFCCPVLSDLDKVDMKRKECRLFAHLPENMSPSAIKIHKMEEFLLR